jgi:hypothetical protein
MSMNNVRIKELLKADSCSLIAEKFLAIFACLFINDQNNKK